MDKRLLIGGYQSENKQISSRIPSSNDSRPSPLNRSKTCVDRSNNGNKQNNRYNRQNTNDNRFRKGLSKNGDTNDDDDNDNHGNNNSTNNRKIKKAELNNQDLDDGNSSVVLINKLKKAAGSGSGNGGNGSNNINHLLNFKFLRQEPCHVYENYRNFKFNVKSSPNKSLMFTKEAFLQANCQFLVNDDGDYSRHFNNPDTLVDWCKIEEVLLRSHQTISCPICLYPPIAAKITKCGHIYCWSCILNYLALGENKWRKCPICFESIYKDDLKSVRTLKINEYKVGDRIELNLMFKEKASTLIYPLNLFKFYESNKPKSLNDFAKLHDYDVCKKYLKLQAIEQSYINQEIVKRETSELQKQLDTEVCEDNVKLYINEAFNLLKNRENNITEQKHQQKVNESPPPSPPPVVNEKVESLSVRYKDAFELTEATAVNDVCEIEDEIKSEVILNDKHKDDVDDDDDDVEANRKASTKITNEKSFYSYFYQAEDGQRIYMNSLNLRCLMHEYGRIENCPLKIEAKIVAIENMFMNDELRRRFRYLAHIPLHSEFQIVELDLKEPILSNKTLEIFDEQIRSKELQRKQKEERERKMERRNYLRMNTFPQQDLFTFDDDDYDNIPQERDYNQEFPDILPSQHDLNRTPSIEITQRQATISSSSGEQASNSATNNESNHQVSFAQMLKSEKAKVEEWPSLATAPATPSFSTMNYSQRVTSSTTTSKSNTKTTGTDSESESSLPAPQYQRSFMFAIDTAIQNLDLNSNDDANSKKPSPGGGKKKQKRAKNLLFST